MLRNALKIAGVSTVRVPQVYSANEERMEMAAIVPKRQTDDLLAKLGEGLAPYTACPRPVTVLAGITILALTPRKTGKPTTGVNFSWTTDWATR